MAVSLLLIAGFCAAALAAPERNYNNAAQQELQQKNPSLQRLEYYLDPNYGVAPDYYEQQPQQQQVSVVPAASGRGASRLESPDPDSEFELLPGAAPPQQPPQQSPVAPSLPGLLPGQRVFIVHMPIPGYRPGTVGGYQPVYIVAAAPRGDHLPGYQNGVVVSPSQEFSPGAGGVGGGLVLGGAPAPLSPFHFAYQHPYQAVQPVPAGFDQFAAGRPQAAELKPEDEQSHPEAKSAKQVRAESPNSDESRNNAPPSPKQTS